MTDAFIYDAVRTPRGRGKSDGALHEVTALNLASQAIGALKERNKLDPKLIDDVVLGCVDPVGEAGGDIARVAAIMAGFGTEVPGVQINRFCASGLDAVNFAAAQVMSGQHDMTIGGGVESMSRVGIGAAGGAWPVDPSIALKSYFVPQGISADLIATKYGFSRDDVDAYAVESQKRAAKSWEDGRFKNSVVPVKDVNGITLLAKDEHMRPTTTMQSLAQLNPSFVQMGEMGGFDAVAVQRYPAIEAVNHVHTPGNSSGIVDGAAAGDGTWCSPAGRLARNALLEAALGLVVLLLAGMLGSTPPARHVQPEWPLAFRWDWSLMDSAPKTRAEVEWGLAWGLLGLVVIQFAFLTTMLRNWTSTIGAALLVYGAYTVFTPVTTDAYPTTYRRPAVSYHAISVANGGKLYAKHCIACHGQAGYGDGPAAASLKPPPADLTGRHANTHTAGDLFWWVGNGIRGTAMPAFAATLDEDERWDLINYVRVLSSARKARRLASLVEDDAWLVAPDFAFGNTRGEARTLREYRGERMVLLVLIDAGEAGRRWGLSASHAWFYVGYHRVSSSRMCGDECCRAADGGSLG